MNAVTVPQRGPMPTQHHRQTVRFCRNPAKRAQITRIAKRFLALLKAHKITEHRTLLDYEMDLAALVGSGQKLDLDTLERFDDFDLAHDMRGIEAHLDRTTGRLDYGIFYPRAARSYYIDLMAKED